MIAHIMMTALRDMDVSTDIVKNVNAILTGIVIHVNALKVSPKDKRQTSEQKLFLLKKKGKRKLRTSVGHCLSLLHLVKPFLLLIV